MRRIPAIIAAAPDLEVLVGGDDWALEGFCAGATGWVTGVADVVPAECVELYERCRAGELDRARAIYQRHAAARALRHDAEARAVLQGRAWTRSASSAARCARRGSAHRPASATTSPPALRVLRERVAA